jgi:hypothetical protein
VRSLLPRTMDEVRVKVPGVDHNSPGARIGDKNGNFFVIRFWLGERVIQSYVDGVDESLVRVELGDNHAVAVLIEHVGQAHHHHVVVVDDRHGDRTVHARSHHLKLPP